MKRRARTLLAWLALAAAAGAAVVVLGPGQDTAQDWEQRKQSFREAALRAGPLIEAIEAFAAEQGKPPQSIAGLVPARLARLPETGLHGCERFEYRSLAHRQGTLVWYDLGSRQGRPAAGPGRFAEGDPDHAILVFTLDAGGRISGARLDRLPEDSEPQPFDPQRWQAGGERVALALGLAESYRLDGMPRAVFESLLGPPDGGRALQGAPWELRINCPTGLLNHDIFLYWPTRDYPQRLYGGTTEAVGDWVYVHSQAVWPWQ
jgi:hypothetical protein